MVSIADYKIIGVKADRTMVTTTKRGAPSDSLLCNFAICHKCAVVIRYMPSRKGWVATDMRKAMYVTSAQHGPQARWVGYVRGKRTYPNEDAAVMRVMHILSLEQTELPLT